MSRAKKSPAETILEYFENAPLSTVEMLLDLVKARVKVRQPKTTAKPAKKKKEPVAISEPATEAS